jgi:hypothetical protein
MSVDWNNDYTHAGPGAKRRVDKPELRRERLPEKSKHTRPYKARTPTNQKLAKERETINVTSRGLKHRIRTLTLATDGFSRMYDELKRANYPGTPVLASSVRNEMLACVKVMIEVGLIHEDDLAHHRRRMKKRRDRDEDE